MTGDDTRTGTRSPNFNYPMASGNTSSTIRLGLVDGPVDLTHPWLDEDRFRILPQPSQPSIAPPLQAHGTYVAGIVGARPSCPFPGVFAEGTIAVRIVFGAGNGHQFDSQQTSAIELAEGIIDLVNVGATVINISAAVRHLTTKGQRRLADALDFAASEQRLVIVAGGNAGLVAGSILTQHPWTIPIVACDDRGSPIANASLSRSISQTGFCYPGRVTSLAPGSKHVTHSGSSGAAAKVSGHLAQALADHSDWHPSQLRERLYGEFPSDRRQLNPPRFVPEWLGASLSSR